MEIVGLYITCSRFSCLHYSVVVVVVYLFFFFFLFFFFPHKCFWTNTYFRSVTWCAISEAEEQKCLDLAGNITIRNIRGKLQCVRGQSATDCMQRIKVRSETWLEIRWTYCTVTTLITCNWTAPKYFIPQSDSWFKNFILFCTFIVAFDVMERLHNK